MDHTGSRPLTRLENVNNIEEILSNEQICLRSTCYMHKVVYGHIVYGVKASFFRVCLLCRTLDMQPSCLSSFKHLGAMKLVSAVARCAAPLSTN